MQNKCQQCFPQKTKLLIKEDLNEIYSVKKIDMVITFVTQNCAQSNRDVCNVGKNMQNVNFKFQLRNIFLIF